MLFYFRRRFTVYDRDGKSIVRVTEVAREKMLRACEKLKYLITVLVDSLMSFGKYKISKFVEYVDNLLNAI